MDPQMVQRDVGAETLPGSPDPEWEKQPAPREVFDAVFGEAVEALETAGVRYVLIGGLASALLGRPRWTQDADLFVRPQDADQALEVLEKAGFRTQRTNPYWIFKAVRDDVLIDVIFRAQGDIYVDNEMLRRAKRSSISETSFWVAPPEDLVVIKAAVASEECPHHWDDALGILAAQELDWEYLLTRARSSARRVLALLVYAESNDLVVPPDVIRELFARIYGEDRKAS